MSPTEPEPTLDVRAGLARPGAFPHAGAQPVVIETHISWIVLAGDFAYKIKKPVKFPFLDYTRPEQRRAFCEEEVRLNRRLAPTTYLGVVPVTREDDGLAIAGPGPVVEYAVRMRRLPEHGMLAALLDRGEVDNGLLREVVGVLAEFHGAAERGPEVEAHGTHHAVRALVTENLGELERFVDRGDGEGGPGVLTPELHGFLVRKAGEFLDDNARLFEGRGPAGRIRDGHGDLHCGNVCRAPWGLVIYDCIEFSRRFRCADVANDLAFLGMDLDFNGYRGFGGVLARLYAERTNDAELCDLMPFYKQYRALVRAKVNALDAESSRGKRAVAKREEALRYALLAATYSLPPVLVLTCGLPASGKSTVARAAAGVFEAPLLRSDVIRKELHGLRPEESAAAPPGGGIYTEEATRRTYEHALGKARKALQAGRSCVVDAAFTTERARRPFVALAEELGVRLLVAEVVVPDDVARERLRRRRAAGDDASDADPFIRMAMSGGFEAPEEVPPTARVTLDGTRPPTDLAVRALSRLVSRD